MSWHLPLVAWNGFMNCSMKSLSADHLFHFANHFEITVSNQPSRQWLVLWAVLPDLGFSAQTGLLRLCLGCKIFIWALGVFWAVQGFCLGLFGIFWALGSIWFLKNFEIFFSKWLFWKHFWPIWNSFIFFICPSWKVVACSRQIEWCVKKKIFDIAF